MDNTCIVENFIARANDAFPKSFSKKQRICFENCFSSLLQIFINHLEQNTDIISNDLKESICELFAALIFQFSFEIFELKDFDDDYEQIMQKIAFVIDEAVFHLLKNGVSEQLNVEKWIEKQARNAFRKALKDIADRKLSQIRDENIVRNNAFFWQLIYIKYTSDNKRIFYPNFFSDGYFLTSEKQFKDYINWGNKFFICCLFVFLILLKFKLLKLLINLGVLNSQILIFGILVLIILGIIYNFVSQKVIFKNAIKTHEKFWVNNIQTIDFIKKLIKEITSIFILVCAIFVLGINCQKAYLGVPICLSAVLVFLFYLRKKYVFIKAFVNKLEKNAIKSYALKTLNEFKLYNKQIKNNIEIYIYEYINYIYKTKNLNYIDITKNIYNFIRNFNRFNKMLYKLNIDEAMHTQIIENRFLPYFY